VVAALVLASATLTASASAQGQTATPPPPEDPPSQWAFRFTPYGWLTWMSGAQTVRGRTAGIDTNVFEMLGQSQSLIPFMAYFEARYQDRISLFVDVMYANLTASQQRTRNFQVNRFVGGRVSADVTATYQQLLVEAGGMYELARVGPDRSAEGPGMAGVGQTSFDALLGVRYWYQEIDLALNLNGTLGANIGGLQLSRDGSRAIARSGSVDWFDPFVGFRIRHRLAPGQDLSLQADLGGFGIGSRISAQAVGLYSFEFGRTGSVGWAGVIGYRALYVDYIQGSGNTLFETNLLQHGPLLGISARF
jgi:hypothetical protein